VEQANGRVPIMAGCGANSTAEAIELAKLRQEGRRRLPAAGRALLQQADAGRPVPALQGDRRSDGDLPTVLYNVPGRTVADMLHDTVLRLAQVPGIVGIKEATGNIERAQWLIRDVPKGFAVYSGDDPTAVALMLCGGQGNVSVTANVAPRLMHELCVAAVAGDTKPRHGTPAQAAAAAQKPVRRSQPDSREMGDGPHGADAAARCGCR
jgi:4-hydroxy-tetrahydrodipicolinate synthase